MTCFVYTSCSFSIDNKPQVWKSVNENKAELELLAEDWTWSSKDLKYVEIEAPDIIMNRLLEEGIYRPKIYLKNVIRKGRELREVGLLDEEEAVSSLFNEDNMVKALAGEVPMEIPVTRMRPPPRKVTTRGRHLGLGADVMEEEDEHEDDDTEEVQQVEGR